MNAVDYLAVIATGLAVLGGITALLHKLFTLLRRVNHFLDDVAGESARPGVPAHPGLVEQVSTLRERQEEIAVVAMTAASDVAAVRLELTTNGGESTKDEVTKALAAARRTEDLLRRHMENGLEIMEVGVHNDEQIKNAIVNLGGTVEDFRPFPPVDIGSSSEDPGDPLTA